jgi:hypothetical protein
VEDQRHTHASSRSLSLSLLPILEYFSPLSGNHHSCLAKPVSGPVCGLLLGAGVEPAGHQCHPEGLPGSLYYASVWIDLQALLASGNTGSRTRCGYSEWMTCIPNCAARSSPPQSLSTWAGAGRWRWGETRSHRRSTACSC